MSSESPAQQRLSLLQQTIKSFSIGLVALTFGRIVVAAMTPALGLRGFHKDVTFLLINLIVVGYIGSSVYRLTDRAVRLMFTALAILLVSLQFAYLFGDTTKLVSLIFRGLDAVAIAFLAGIVYRLATLYAEAKEAIEAEFLHHLAVGTSTRIGVDFLSGLTESIAQTLNVRCACVTQAGDSNTSEEIVASSASASAEMPEFSISKTIDCSGEGSLAILGMQVTSLPLADASGLVLGHICLIDENQFIMTDRQRSTILVFGARAAAELERKKLDEVNSALESKLHQVQKLESLGVMAGGIAHDFNNLLSAIRSNASVVSNELNHDAIATENLHGIDLAVDRGAALCNRLLAYAGCAVRKNAVCNINTLVRQLETVIQATHPAKRFDLQLTGENTNVWGDDAQLSQVLLNLMTNAAEASALSEGLTVRTWTGTDLEMEQASASDTGHVFIDVADRGHGIQPAETDRLFDPFYSTKGHGRGLGLAAVLGIVNQHGGGISVQSKPGVGTTFTVSLPATTERETLVNPQRRSVRLDAAKSSGQILLVDDDAIVRNATRSLLEAAGMEVMVANDGSKAIEVFKREGNVFQSIIFDQTMPGKSGIETYRELLELGATSRCILISGYSKQSLHDCPAELQFLAKPFSSEELLAAVNGATASSK